MTQPTWSDEEEESVFRRTMAVATDWLWAGRLHEAALAALYDVLHRRARCRSSRIRRRDDPKQ